MLCRTSLPKPLTRLLSVSNLLLHWHERLICALMVQPAPVAACGKMAAQRTAAANAAGEIMLLCGVCVCARVCAAEECLAGFVGMYHVP